MIQQTTEVQSAVRFATHFHCHHTIALSNIDWIQLIENFPSCEVFRFKESIIQSISMIQSHEMKFLAYHNTQMIWICLDKGA